MEHVENGSLHQLTEKNYVTIVEKVIVSFVISYTRPPGDKLVINVPN